MEIEKLLNEGKQQKEIAKELETSAETVSRKLKDFKISRAKT